MDGPQGRGEPVQAPRANQTLERGGTIGRYMVLGLIGRGAMGDVYLAHDPKLARKLAVKLVRAHEGEAGAESRMRLLREAQAIAKLSHPNVVVVHDVGTFRDSVFLAMEYIEGTTIRAWREAAPRSWREVLEMYAAAGRGLAAAHQVGMVHRDFKPDNVMVGRDGQARVLDFGLARQVPSVVERAAAPPPVAAGDQTPVDDRLTRTGAMVGTPAYMAPEQFLGQPTDARSDQFSFCVAVYEGLYGVRPFAGKTILALTTNVLEGRVAGAPADAKIPPHIRRALLRGLSSAPAARWPSMAALLDALSQDPPRPRRHGLALPAAAGLAAALVVAASVAGGRAWRARPATAPPDGPAARARVEGLRRDLALALTTANAGACEAGVAAARQVVSQARALGYLPLEAEALNTAAQAGADCLAPGQAVQLYKEALRAAVASRHDEAAASAASLMAGVMAGRLHAAGAARDWLELGRALLRRIGAPRPLLEARLETADGIVSGAEGNRQAALARFQHALALQKGLAPASLDVARAEHDVGVALEEVGRVEESVASFDRARRVAVELGGPGDARVAGYLADRGAALNALHLYAQALDDHRHALAIWRASGAAPLRLAAGLTGEGESLLGLERAGEATASLEEALRIETEGHTPLPATGFALARALWPVPAEHARAVALAERAKAEYERDADVEHARSVQVWLLTHAR